ncbi:Hsp33 family molecular chaperone HslO, partial [Lactobacillus gasseri]
MLAKENVEFSCDCSKEKYSKILSKLKQGKLKEIIEKYHGEELV